MTERTADEDTVVEEAFSTAVADLMQTCAGDETRLRAGDDLDTVLEKLRWLRNALDRVDRCYDAVMGTAAPVADAAVCPNCFSRNTHLFDPPAGRECHDCGREFDR